MKKILFLFCLLSASLGYSQELQPVCGTSIEDQNLFIERLKSNIADVEAGILEERGGIAYVPVHFHLVGDASGNGKVREVRVLEQLCALNATFLPHGIQFYISPHPTYGMFDKSINNNGVYSSQSNSFLMQTRRHPNAINYYIVDVAESGNNQPGLTLAYYSGQQDWIVSRRDRINGSTTNNTVAHETGHFFSLAHPFFGWEETTGFAPGYPGWPIAPATTPWGNPVEKMDGSNCTVAADLVCDTPPDYKFAFTQTDCSNYDGGAKDPMGVLVDPMETNMMSYFEPCSVYVFTPMQSSIMLADLGKASRNYLDNNYTPVATSIDSPVDLLITPANGETTQYYNSVLLEWKAVAGATHYMLEVDDLPSYLSPNIKTYLTTNTSYLLTNLNANDSYYWRVKPFNPSVGCATPRSRNVKTSGVATTSVKEIEGLSAWQISPNPAADVANILISAGEPFDAQISVLDAAGRTVLQLPMQPFSEGQNNVAIPLESLSNGFYFVVLNNGIAQDVKKLAVLH
jgi:hypothetical protein